MKKKALWATICAMSVFALAACGKADTEIASMKGAKITVSDFYEKAKTDQNSQQIVLDMILSDVFTSKYGDDISKDDVNKEIKNIFGDNFEEQLKASKLTRKDVEKSVKEQLAFKAGLKSHVKLTDADLKAAWDAFHPEVEAQIIAVASEDDAKAVKKELDKKGADFAKIAKKKSIHPTKDDGGKIKFDSSTDATQVPDEVKTIAWKLKDGEVSEPVAVMSSYSPMYYVVKMVKNQDKGNDMKKFEKEVKQNATDAKLNDSAFTTKVIGEELKAANVKIKDETFANILTNFIDATETKKDTKDSSDKSDSKATDKSDAKDTKKSSDKTEESK
jgi:PPIC-type PPIASE domain.